MPRKKKVPVTESSVDIEHHVKDTSLRRSSRKTEVSIKSKVDVNAKHSNKNLSEDSKQSSKKRKVKASSNNFKLENSSPDSTDSGISSGVHAKDENSAKTASELEEETSEDYTTSLKGSCNFIKDDDLKQKTNAIKLEKQDKKLQAQKKSKRKTSDRNEIDHSEDEEKPAEKKKSKKPLKNIKEDSNLELDFSLQSEKRKLKQNAKISSPSTSSANVPSTKEESVLQILTQQEFNTSNDVKIDQSERFKTDNIDESSSDSDWEEVEEHKEQNLEKYNPVIPKEGVEITIDCPELNVRKRKKKQFDEMEYIRLYINRELREQQLNTHKTHLLCLLAHGLFVNNLLNSPDVKALAFSLLPCDILTLTAGRKIDKIDTEGIQNIVSWFRESFSFENVQLPFININKNMISYFQHQESFNASEYNLLFIVLARILGFNTRFCISFYPLTHKPKHLFKKSGNKKKKDCKDEDIPSMKIETDTSEVEKKSIKKCSKKSVTKIKKPSTDDPPKKGKSRPQRTSGKSYKMSSGESDDDDKDFKISKEMKPRRHKASIKQQPGKKLSRNVLSSDSEPPSPVNSDLKLDDIICWCEVFCKTNKQWIPIECSNNIINEPYEIEKLLPKPVTYIVAYDNKSYIKDVTRRYCSDYMTSTLKMRADADWWEETLEPFSPPNSKQDKEEEKKLDDMLINKPLPKTISEYKNHPLYALKRHLLKFEAIYPPDAAPVGFLREEPIYARDNVCKLHSRETWVKEARVVRAGEEPYKIVKARPKWDRIVGVMRTDLSLEVFGFWQTNPYEPPTAVGGKVPRNEYGNVELFKPCMLPKGTVHLQIPGLNRVAKKLGIDCSPAVVGFDGHKGSIHPVYDGFVVCKEFKDTLLAAWDEEQENARKREEEKREKRIYGNWKKLIRGLLIRERIKLKYDVK